MFSSAYLRIRDRMIQRPFRWTVWKFVTIIVLWIGCAAFFTTLQLLLRYNYVDHNAWTIVFMHRLPAWAPWILWTPIVISITQRILARQASGARAFWMVFFSLVMVALLATAVEAGCSFIFWGGQGWSFKQVLFAFITNRMQNHIGIAFSLLFFLGLRTLANPEKNLLSRPREANGGATLAVRHRTHTELIPFDEIDHVSASGSYVEILTTKNKVIATGSLKTFQSQLPYPMFVRIHRSHIVRARAVRTVARLSNEDHVVTTALGHELRLSRTYKDALELLTGYIPNDRPAN
jgi:hypothetical protein